MQSQNITTHTEKHTGDKVYPRDFALRTIFTLKKVETLDDPFAPVAIDSPRDPEMSSGATSFDLEDDATIKRSLKFEQRPWIIHGQYPCEGSESKQHVAVSARWDPEGACSYMVEEAPVFHPREEEFKDTLKYIDSIRHQVEPYGLCRIIPPPSWQSTCFLEEDDLWKNHKFSTQVQHINELQNLCSSEKAYVAHDTRDPKRRKLGYEFGDGCAANFISNECHEEESCRSTFGSELTLTAFKRYADYFQQQYFARDVDLSNPNTSPVTNRKKWEASELDIEGEYWRIVEKPTEEIEVLSATDLDHRVFGNGFPVSCDPEQETDFSENHTSGWNLNHISRLPGSLLSLEMLDSSSNFAHRLHVGMCFSSLPWTVEKHHLYQLYYMHLGAPKIWYGTPASDSCKSEAVQKKQFPNLSKENLDMLHNMGRQLSPGTLKSEDVRVYRCIQRPREFVLFLPGAYHSGFDCGFNISASAVFAPLDWLLHGLASAELYREQRRKTLISFDRMLLGAANEAVKAQWECFLKGRKTPKILMWKEASGKDGILARVLRMRIRSEARCREYLSLASQSKKMDRSFYDGDEKRECNTCYYDLYLSSGNCPCSPNKFSCLKHTKHLCLCPSSEKIFLLRFLMSELEILAEAVEGKVTAIRRWVKEDLGRALYQDKKPSKPQNGPTKDPYSSVAEVPSQEDKGCASKLLEDEASGGNLKGKEVAHGAALSGRSEDNTSSSSSSEMDIEAYVSCLQALTGGKHRNEAGSSSNRSKKGESEVDIGGSSVPRAACASDTVIDKGNARKLENVICLSDNDD